MAFDIATASNHDIDNTGMFMPFLDVAGNKITSSDALVGVTLRSRYSTSAQGAVRRSAIRNLTIQQRLEGKRPDPETVFDQIEQDLLDLLASCTVSWTFDTLDGAAFPCTPENVRRFWGDDRFRLWREQAQRFLASDVNFMKR